MFIVSYDFVVYNSTTKVMIRTANYLPINNFYIISLIYKMFFFKKLIWTLEIILPLNIATLKKQTYVSLYEQVKCLDNID